MSVAIRPEGAAAEPAEQMDNMVPTHGYAKVPVVGLGGSAGSIEALQEFFITMPAQSGLAFVVIIHLAPDHESKLTDLLQRCTRMRVVKVEGRLDIQANVVYVIPPGSSLVAEEGDLCLGDIPEGRGKHVVVDIFFRTLADTHGAHAAAVVLSGMDGDGANGIRRIKERGGLTVAQDPEHAIQSSMPRNAISTGMIDWVLPVRDMPARLLAYFRLEHNVELPPEDGPAPAGVKDVDEAALREVLTFLRTRTGRDFASYKRATVLRRIGRRMQVNGIDNLAGYLTCLRTRTGESTALLQDLLISVTNFFRDTECFAALEQQIPTLFAGKGSNDAVRAWVVACATGEEAYSVAMLLMEHARTLEAPPLIQVFATDLDQEAIQAAREGVYPPSLVADVDEERLRRFFAKEHRGYRIRRELREAVLFSLHDVLHDSPFGRLDLVSCRNLLIYLNREAQARVFNALHFALVPSGKLFLGSSESVDDASPLFGVVDKKHRIYGRKPTPRVQLPLPMPHAGSALTRALEIQQQAAPVIHGFGARTGSSVAGEPSDGGGRRDSLRPPGWAEVHLKLLERLAPPSVVVNGEYDIVHLSPSAGRFLQMAGGEPSRNLLGAVQPELRIDLRAALHQCQQQGTDVELPPIRMSVAGGTAPIALRVMGVQESGESLFVVLFEARPGGETADATTAQLQADPLARHLDAEIDRLKSQLRDTVEQYEAGTEELKASNEELQAMNEELRAAGEELETSREELQSINEELSTVNQELKSKVEQLSGANSDMQNLMDATRIATVFLDRELRIMRFTPAAVSLFNLIPGDIGRPLSDMASQLDYPELGADADRVLQTLVPNEREVGQAGGSWFLARLMPYRTMDDRIGGVVFTFIDISERKRGEEMRLWLSAVVSATSDAIISFAVDETIVSWNNGAQRLFGYSPEEAIGKPMAMLAAGDPGQQARMVGEVVAGRQVQNSETVRRRKDGSDLHVAITASPIKDEAGRVMAGTAIIRDITAQRDAAEALRQSEERWRLVIENAVEYAIFGIDLERRVTSWNAGAGRILLFTEPEMMGRLADVIFTPEDRKDQAPEKEARTARMEGRAADERMHMRKDGSRFRGTSVLVPMRNSAGQATGFVKIVRDLSERQRDPA